MVRFNWSCYKCGGIWDRVTGGPDLVCQSGPSAWPSLVYAQSAVYPMAHSAAQDVFPVIPGDTDFRIFSQDYGNFPSLDIIFVLGGYYYHTSYGTVEKLLPGSIQARGDNLYSILKAFSNSSMLENTQERRSLDATKEEHAIFFDYLSWFIIIYPQGTAVILHSIPVAVFLFMLFVLYFLDSGTRSCFAIFNDFVTGMLFHAAGVILAVIFPIVFSVVRFFFSSYANFDEGDKAEDYYTRMIDEFWHFLFLADDEDEELLMGDLHGTKEYYYLDGW